MKRTLLALCLALTALTLRPQTGSAGTNLTFGGVISTINHTADVVAAMPTSVQSLSVIDVSPVVSPMDPYNPGDPSRTSYDNAIYRNASSIVALRSDLATVQVTGVGCGGDGCPPATVAQTLADAGIQTNWVVTATLSKDLSGLTVYYDSTPDACVLTPGPVCVPPNPV